MGAGVQDESWLAEAVIEFLQGPLYINPLMGFIDEKCLSFTPEEENKLEYTIVHEEFKQVVDSLLTDFLEEIGVSPERFYETMAKAQEGDKLSGFVIQTILTVDDFLMFKTMMVKRNLDLTNQVLEAVESARMASQLAAQATSAGPADISQALEASAALAKDMEANQRLQQVMRALQLEDEDVALSAAMAASLRDQAAVDSELADINQAIALSLALEEERKRREAAAAAAASSSPAPAKATPPSAAPSPAPAAADSLPATPASAARPSLAPIVKPTPPPAAPVVHAEAVGPVKSPPSISKPAAPVGPTVGELPPLKAAPSLSLPEDLFKAPAGRWVPAPIDAPTGAQAPKDVVNGPSMMLPSTSVKQRAAGFRSDGPVGSNDLEAVRNAARQAADAQKKLVGPGAATEANAWLQEAKLKLIAQKKAERDQETDAYRAARGQVKPAAAAPVDAADAKRAALREQLAANMKAQMLNRAAAM